MKMFKKIMAVALVGVMALSMLTGCAVTDKLKNDHVLDAMSDVASAYAKRDETSKVDTIKFESKSSLNTELKNLLKDAKAELSNSGKTATVKAGVKVDGFKTADNSKTVYYAVVLVEAVAKA